MDKSPALRAALVRMKLTKRTDDENAYATHKTDAQLIWRYVERLEEELDLVKDALFLRSI